MDDARFDTMARGLGSRLTRRRAGGLAAGALLALGVATRSDARKKKKKKKNKGGSGGTAVNYTCLNLGTACGGSIACSCRLTASTEQICLNALAGSFPPCISQANCAAGTYCDFLTGRCALPCPN